MPLDGYFLTKLNEEILTAIKGHFLRRIKMPSKRSFLLEFYRRKTTYLYIDLSSNSPHLRLSEDMENESDHPFLHSFKRLLLNNRLSDIIQVDKDRILKFQFVSNDPFLGEIKRELILEIMGRNSNLIITENNIIIDAYLKRFNEHTRSILPKLEYVPFPTNKTIFKFENIHTYESPRDLFRDCMGFSMDLAKFVYEYKIDIDNEPLKPVKYNQSFHAFDLRLGNPIYFNSLSLLLADVYEPLKRISPLYKQLEKDIKRRQDRIKQLTIELEKNQDYDTYKTIADAIYASGLDLKSNHTEYMGYALDYTLSLNDNAQKLYKLYKKKKDSLDHLKNQISIRENELIYYQDLLDNFDDLDLNDLAEELNPKPKKKRSKKQTHEIYNGPDYKIHIGKSSHQNEYLTHELAHKDDYWFHVKDAPGAHVILQGNVHEASIRKAATFAALGSPLKHASSVPVIYTKIRFVKKIKGRPGFYVTFKHEKTIYIDP